MKTYDAIIIGAGAAGLMATAQLVKRGKKVLLLDSAKKAGEKIRISGGGRCNFTNLKVTADNFLSNNPSFCISALKRFSSQDFINLVEKHQISYHQKTLGQLFCDDSSSQIIQMLLKECQIDNPEYDDKIILDTIVLDIQKTADNFLVTTNRGSFESTSLVIASGGLSIPKMGASDFGYKIARKFGLKIIQTTPALVPFTLSPELLEQTKALSGVAAPSIVAFKKRKFTESLLFTHKGLSGPAILQISSYWQHNNEIIINMTPDLEVFSWLQAEKNSKPKQEIHNVLAALLPKSLVLFILDQCNIRGSLADLSNQKLKIIADNINSWKVIPSGTEGFAKAEVTLGGVDTDEISSQTFESKKVKNLYFIGEVLDVTGHLGGYNFQWAWSSGYAAGQQILSFTTK